MHGGKPSRPTQKFLQNIPTPPRRVFPQTTQGPTQLKKSLVVWVPGVLEPCVQLACQLAGLCRAPSQPGAFVAGSVRQRQHNNDDEWFVLGAAPEMISHLNREHNIRGLPQTLLPLMRHQTRHNKNVGVPRMRHAVLVENLHDRGHGSWGGHPQARSRDLVQNEPVVLVHLGQRRPAPVPPPGVHPAPDRPARAFVGPLGQRYERQGVLSCHHALHEIPPGESVHSPRLHPRAGHVDNVELETAVSLSFVEPKDDVRQLLRHGVALVVTGLKHKVVGEQEDLLTRSRAGRNHLFQSPNQVVRLAEVGALASPITGPSPGLVLNPVFANHCRAKARSAGIPWHVERCHEGPHSKEVTGRVRQSRQLHQALDVAVQPRLGEHVLRAGVSLRRRPPRFASPARPRWPFGWPWTAGQSPSIPPPPCPPATHRW